MDPMTALTLAQVRYDDLVRETHSLHRAEAPRRRARRRSERRRAWRDALRRGLAGPRPVRAASSTDPEPSCP